MILLSKNEKKAGAKAFVEWVEDEHRTDPTTLSTLLRLAQEYYEAVSKEEDE